MRLAHQFLTACLVATVSTTTPAFAQGIADGFAPSVAGDTVRSAAVQPDGKIVFGGLFAGVAGTVRTNLARVHPDGTLDSAFDPSPNDMVRCVVAQSEGSFLVGGDFTSVAGTTRLHLARFNSDGTLDTSFDPAPNGAVHSIAVQPDGKIVIGGKFTNVGGQARAAIARLAADGNVDASFNPGADDTVHCVFAQADGRILVAGSFITLGGESRRCIGRVNANGAVDSTFNPLTNGFAPDTGGVVFSVALQADRKVVIGGSFVTATAHSRTNFARLNPDGTLDETFNHWVRGTVTCLALQPDSTIVVGGLFHAVSSILTQTFTNLARFRSDAVVEDGFRARPNLAVHCLALQPDDKIIVGGAFTLLTGGGRMRIARVHPNLRLDNTLNPGAAQQVLAVALQPDGRILVGGSFTTLGGIARRSIGRLHADGAVDTTFSVAGLTTVRSLAVQGDGRILIGGFFTIPGEVPYRNLIRVNPDGSIDAAFNPRIDGFVLCMTIQHDGKLLIAGSISSVGGQPRLRIARLNPDGTLETTFSPETDGGINSFALQPDGKIVLGGSFSTLNGEPRSLIGRLNSDGSVDSFNPSAGGTDGSFSPPNVHTVAVQPDGKILVGGLFTQLSGRARGFLGRVHSDGRLDDSFLPGIRLDNEFDTASICLQADGKILVASFDTSSDLERSNLVRLNSRGGLEADFSGGSRGGVANVPPGVNGLAVQADGKLIAIGNFYSLAGQARANIGRFSSPGNAFQSLEIDATGTAATWKRAGACAEVEQVTLQQSTDGTNFSFVGHASRVENGWQLNGLSLPVGINFWLRAQGRTVGSYNNGSSGLMESIAQFWRLPPPYISSVQMLGEGAFQFSFANTNAVALSVLASSDVAAPSASWENLGTPMPVGSGLYQFTDPEATNHARRFYQLRSP